LTNQKMRHMKKLIFALILLTSGIQLCQAQANLPSVAKTPSKEEQELLDLSKTKWTWMADKKVDALKDLFTEKCVFVHMGGSWGKDQELNTIGGYIILLTDFDKFPAFLNPICFIKISSNEPGVVILQ